MIPYVDIRVLIDEPHLEETLEPINQILQQFAQKKGSVRHQFKKKNRDSKIAWLLHVEAPYNERLGSQYQNALIALEHAISVLEDHEISIKQLAKTCKVELLCFFQGETINCYLPLEKEVIAKLSKLPISIVLNLYELEEKDEDELEEHENIHNLITEEPKEAHVALRIFSETLLSQEISQILNTTPTEKRNKGDFLRKNRDGKEIYADRTLWELKSIRAESEPLSEHIEELIDFLDSKQEAFQYLKQHCEMEIFCIYSTDLYQNETLFDQGFFQEISRIPIDITISIHG